MKQKILIILMALFTMLTAKSQEPHVFVGDDVYIRLFLEEPTKVAKLGEVFTFHIAGVYIEDYGAVDITIHDAESYGTDHIYTSAGNVYINLSSPVESVPLAYYDMHAGAWIKILEEGYYNMVVNKVGTNITLTVHPCATVTLTKEGFGTYYNSKLDMQLPKGLKARIVTANESTGVLTYQTIADGYVGTNEASLAETGVTARTVPAGVAVMLQGGESDATQTFNIELIPKTDSRTFASNLLHGSDVETTTTGDGKHYKLSYNTSGTNLGWYWGGTDGAAFTSAAHKVWLALPESAGARGFFGLPGDGETTSMEDVKWKTENVACDQEVEAWYTLDCRKLKGRPTAKGVYIHNGRKEVIR